MKFNILTGVAQPPALSHSPLSDDDELPGTGKLPGTGQFAGGRFIDSENFSQFNREHHNFRQRTEDKIHLSVHPDDYENAFNALSGLLFSNDSPIDAWKVTNVDKYASSLASSKEKLAALKESREKTGENNYHLMLADDHFKELRQEKKLYQNKEQLVEDLFKKYSIPANVILTLAKVKEDINTENVIEKAIESVEQDIMKGQRMTKGTQFTLYLYNNKGGKEPYDLQEQKANRDFINALEKTLRENGIRLGVKPASDVSAVHWTYASYRHESSKRKTSTEAIEKLRNQPTFKWLAPALRPANSL